MQSIQKLKIKNIFPQFMEKQRLRKKLFQKNQLVLYKKLIIIAAQKKMKMTKLRILKKALKKKKLKTLKKQQEQLINKMKLSKNKAF